ncbi:MAG: CoA transferase [Nitriliruptoraceae bacterium]
MPALSDVRVIDLTIARAGPTAVRQLSDWGASVIRIDPPGGQIGISGKTTGPDYLNLHRGKRAMTLDLKAAQGLAIFKRLVADADVVVENFRPPVKHRLGIDYATLSAEHPRLIYGSISGYGQDGPYASRGAVDQIIQGVSGLMSVTGEPDGDPMRVGIPISDVAAGHQLALGIVAALYERTSSGQGQWVSVSLLEAVISFLDFQAARWTVDGQVPERQGNHHPTFVPMGTYQASDLPINLAASSDRLWESFCMATGAGHLASDERFADAAGRITHRVELNAAVAEIIATRPAAEWVELLNEASVPCGVVNTVDQTFADPQVAHLAMTTTVEHATRGPVDILRPPVGMSRTPTAVAGPAPLIGEHTDEILAELGHSPGEIADLRNAGVIGAVPNAR